ncbi:hypothetical protein NQ318_014256 [Aromia moschata]|uniref:DDE-1 domain-containing protein n=1 Tax=Aromia moschata TaxID=1265417 RepID=A0AAV8Z0E7_9CUCU|nr:hypothetical protein NQ318_014256 [Aromia moschata]
MAQDTVDAAVFADSVNKAKVKKVPSIETLNSEMPTKELRKDRGKRVFKSLLNKLRCKKYASATISKPDPTYRVAYLGNVVTGWAKGKYLPVASINMPRKNKSDKKLTKVDSIIMENAVKSVINDGSSIRGAAKAAGICHQTLKRYVLKYRNASLEEQPVKFAPNYQVRKVFSTELELLLKEYLIKACKLHHGLTRKDVKKLAYQLALKNELKFPASWEKHNEAGEDWLKGFRNRQRDISIRKPEGTSLSRATAFNETNVNEFFNNLSNVYQRFPGLEASDIYNLDETALTTVHNPPKVLGARGQKQIGQVTSGERGVLVTACCIINAAGQAVPPYLIFPRVYLKPHMLTGAPNGTGGNANKSGWVNGEIFVDILKHFVKFVKCSKEKPVILIMDNHESHITIDSLEFSKDNGIVLVTLPPHTSGKLQPLDKTVYKSLKTNYNVACNEWMISHPGRPITIYDIAALFGTAYVKAFTIENIMNGFKSTGIWPMNRSIFTADDFLASYVTDRENENIPEKQNISSVDIEPTEEKSTETRMIVDEAEAGSSTSVIIAPKTPQKEEIKVLFYT